MLAVGLAMGAPAQASAATAPSPVRVQVATASVTLTNGLVERRWERSSFRTSLLADLRGKNRVWSRDRRDFALTIGGAEFGSEQFAVQSVRTEQLPGGGMRVAMELSSPLGPALTATRVAEAYPGVAGILTQTILHPAVGLSLGGATLDEAAVGPAAPSLHAFRAGSDWREPGYGGPPVFAGDPIPAPGATPTRPGAGGRSPDRASGSRSRTASAPCSWSWSATTSPPRGRRTTAAWPACAWSTHAT